MEQRKFPSIQQDLVQLVANTTVVYLGSALINGCRYNQNFVDNLRNRETLGLTASFGLVYLGWKLGRRTANYFRNRN